MTVHKTVRSKGWMHCPKNTKNTQIDKRPSLLSIIELLSWTLNDLRKVIQKMIIAPAKSALKKIPKKSFSDPGTRILWNPLKK